VESAVRQAAALRARQGHRIDGAIHHSDGGSQPNTMQYISAKHCLCRGCGRRSELSETPMTGRDDHRALQERMHSCRVSGSYLLGMKCTFPRKEVRIKHGMLHQRRSARRKMTRIVRIDNHPLVGRLLIDVGALTRHYLGGRQRCHRAGQRPTAGQDSRPPSIMLKAGGRSRASRALSSTLTVRWRRSAGGLTRFRLVLAVLSGLVHQPYRP
jgi:hypothetical protein